MVIKFERPFDLLNNCKNKTVLVYLKNNKKYSGILLSFDLNINIVLDKCFELIDDKKTNLGLNFIRGDVIESISPGN